MPIRYFKCHTRPFPCYDLDGMNPTHAPGSGGLTFRWKNGPNGEATPTKTEVFVEVLTGNPGFTNLVTTDGTATSLDASAVSGWTFRFQVRRENSAGYGEWSSFGNGVVA